MHVLLLETFFTDQKKKLCLRFSFDDEESRKGRRVGLGG